MSSTNRDNDREEVLKMLDVCSGMHDLEKDLIGIENGSHKDRMLRTCQAITYIDYVLIQIFEELEAKKDLVSMEKMMQVFFKSAQQIINTVSLIFHNAQNWDSVQKGELEWPEPLREWTEREKHWRAKLKQVLKMLERTEQKLGKKWDPTGGVFNTIEEE